VDDTLLLRFTKQGRILSADPAGFNDIVPDQDMDLEAALTLNDPMAAVVSSVWSLVWSFSTACPGISPAS
jgi:hypothetical protein